MSIDLFRRRNEFERSRVESLVACHHEYINSSTSALKATSHLNNTQAIYENNTVSDYAWLNNGRELNKTTLSAHKITYFGSDSAENSAIYSGEKQNFFANNLINTTFNQATSYNSLSNSIARFIETLASPNHQAQQEPKTATNIDTRSTEIAKTSAVPLASLQANIYRTVVETKKNTATLSPNKYQEVELENIAENLEELEEEVLNGAINRIHLNNLKRKQEREDGFSKTKQTIKDLFDEDKSEGAGIVIPDLITEQLAEVLSPEDAEIFSLLLNEVEEYSRDFRAIRDDLDSDTLEYIVETISDLTRDITIFLESLNNFDVVEEILSRAGIIDQILDLDDEAREFAEKLEVPEEEILSESEIDSEEELEEEVINGAINRIHRNNLKRKQEGEERFSKLKQTIKDLFDEDNTYELDTTEQAIKSLANLFSQGADQKSKELLFYISESQKDFSAEYSRDTPDQDALKDLYKEMVNYTDELLEFAKSTSANDILDKINRFSDFAYEVIVGSNPSFLKPFDFMPIESHLEGGLEEKIEGNISSKIFLSDSDSDEEIEEDEELEEGVSKIFLSDSDSDEEIEEDEELEEGVSKIFLSDSDSDSGSDSDSDSDEEIEEDELEKTLEATKSEEQLKSDADYDFAMQWMLGNTIAVEEDKKKVLAIEEDRKKVLGNNFFDKNKLDGHLDQTLKNGTTEKLTARKIPVVKKMVNSSTKLINKLKENSELSNLDKIVIKEILERKDVKFVKMALHYTNSSQKLVEFSENEKAIAALYIKNTKGDKDLTDPEKLLLKWGEVSITNKDKLEDKVEVNNTFSLKDILKAKFKRVNEDDDEKPEVGKPEQKKLSIKEKWELFIESGKEKWGLFIESGKEKWEILSEQWKLFTETAEYNLHIAVEQFKLRKDLGIVFVYKANGILKTPTKTIFVEGENLNSAICSDVKSKLSKVEKVEDKKVECKKSDNMLIIMNNLLRNESDDCVLSGDESDSSDDDW
jgi:hypothetical protein